MLGAILSLRSRWFVILRIRFILLGQNKTFSSDIFYNVYQGGTKEALAMQKPYLVGVF